MTTDEFQLTGQQAEYRNPGGPWIRIGAFELGPDGEQRCRETIEWCRTNSGQALMAPLLDAPHHLRGLGPDAEYRLRETCI